MTNYLKSAVNTMIAPWWKIWLAKILGTKSVGVDYFGGERSEITCYRWRGVLYMTGYKRSHISSERSQ